MDGIVANGHNLQNTIDNVRGNLFVFLELTQNPVHWITAWLDAIQTRVLIDKPLKGKTNLEKINALFLNVMSKLQLWLVCSSYTNPELS